MPRFPVAPDPRAANLERRLLASTEREARSIAGQPVTFVVGRLPIKPGLRCRLDEFFAAQMSEGVVTPLSLPAGWGAAIRYWRPAPMLPVGRSFREALGGAIGVAADVPTAEAILGRPAILSWRRDHRRHRSFESAYHLGRDAVEGGEARITFDGVRWILERAYWSPAEVRWADLAAGLVPTKKLPRATRRGGFDRMSKIDRIIARS